MKRTKRLIAMVGAALAASPALAQAPPAADPIDALLRQRAAEEEPDGAAAGSTAVATDPAPTAAARQPYVPPRPALTEPVFLHETGKAPDGPPTPADEAYEARLRASAAAMRGHYGPLEGGWTLTVGGQALYALQLVDRDGYVDGAWRDLRRPGALEGSGYIADIPRTGGDVTLRFAGGVMAVLRAADGRWTGQVTEDGRTQAATLVRRGP